MRDRELFIGGRWRPARQGRRALISDPATGDPVGSTAIADADDIADAVAEAKRALPGWAATHPDERARILRRAADLIVERLDSMADLLTREQGKPIPDAVKEIRFGVEVIRYYAEEGRRIGGSIRASARSDARSLVVSAPVGVVGAITPWNYPVDIYAWKIGPALAAGCTMVVKPPPETPLAIALVVQCLAEAGLPAGVLNDLPGSGAEAGAALASHPDVRLVTATASTAAGQSIMRAAAATLKRVSLELGGQCPFVVLEDADVAEAAAAAARRSFSNMGQICIAVNRILVADRVHDAFLEALAVETGRMKLGHGVEPGVLYGPVLNEGVRSRTRRHIEDALAHGGRLIVGGSSPKGAEYDRGCFFNPTIVDGPDDSALVMTEESYGPLVGVRRFRDDAEGLALANALPYGLASYVYGRDLERAWAFAEKVESGAVGVNVNDTSELQAPFGGWKLSGLGRELGVEGLMAFRESKHIRLRLRNGQYG
ncbi:succinate-semialdehyde dehydrogenase/glutarate-semialdehyde dehydrogenase [Roseiarcus fermentans]|uniref:Succinate-semialdehyde dehydrogenase/glutarate-semialdehyde dehydrogenase n=1 Tax=Roseiarcus fermentans TaxID=1473586 RepID=A0A366F9U2_9HYPH|nr:aldehyde dehydrogenase family protein [Roseiarcus fermentans]RBP11381.1 succinate-semialdehyde dehydrogenase/glutarate-semialdehyde dehydrogenase [Roseiarcus fermentans]